MNSFYSLEWDAYPLLIAFGVICGVFWMVSGALGFVKAEASLVAGGVTYLIFAILFPIIVEKTQANPFTAVPLPCERYLYLKSTNTTITANSTAFAVAGCKTDSNYYDKHVHDSFEFFWGASLACFILGAYHLAGMMYEVYQIRMASDTDKKPPIVAKKEEKNEKKGDEKKEVKKEVKKDAKKDTKKDTEKDTKGTGKKVTEEKKQAAKVVTKEEKTAKKDEKKVEGKKEDGTVYITHLDCVGLKPSMSSPKNPPRLRTRNNLQR